MENDTWRGRGLLISLAVLVVLVIVAAVLKVGFDDTGISPQSDPEAQGTVAFDPETDLVPEEARCTDNHYIDSSNRSVRVGDKDYRQFATAVSIPYAGTTDAAVYRETSAEICGNPTEFKMTLDDMMSWKGFPGADSNKAWIVKIQKLIEKDGLESFIQKDDADTLIVTPLFQKYAGWVNTVLLRFNADGKQSLTSTRNWELPATVTPGTQPIAVLAKDQESKPSWVRTLTDKNGKCLYRIGFNAIDKRIETFPCAVNPPPKTGCEKGACPTPSNPPCEHICPKDPKHNVTPPQGVTPMPKDTLEPTPPPAPSNPMNPTTPPHSDPSPSATPPGNPATDPGVAPKPSDPGTPIGDPDAG